jgi:hypothetical protein
MVLVEPTRFHSNRKRRERVVAEREREVNEATNSGGKEQPCQQAARQRGATYRTPRAYGSEVWMTYPLATLAEVKT